VEAVEPVSTTERPVVDPERLATAAELVITSQYAAAANLARKLRVDPEQARSLLDHLEVVSIVEPGGSERTVLVQPAGLDAALARVREHAAHQRLVDETEQLDEQHGGEVVLRGGSGWPRCTPLRWRSGRTQRWSSSTSRARRRRST
jgi:hypothetical protein